MEIIKYSDFSHLDINQSVISIGNYDGIHIGHQYIIRELTSKSIRTSSKSILLTFDPHPKEFFAPKGHKPFLLTNFSEKANIIGGFPVDYLICFEFNNKFASMPAEDFVNNILIDKLKVSEIIVGYDFNFGKDRKGNTDFLEEMGEEKGFKVSIVTAKKMGDEVISSSHIRELISRGNVRKAARFLGHNYSMSGSVIKGKNVGKKIGFPTVNLSVQNKLLPADGVYSVLVLVGAEKLYGVANIGYQPTFGDENEHSIEAHIMNFNGDLYGSEVSVEFVDRLREERKFSCVDELTMQIEEDVTTAKASLMGK